MITCIALCLVCHFDARARRNSVEFARRDGIATRLFRSFAASRLAAMEINYNAPTCKLCVSFDEYTHGTEDWFGLVVFFSLFIPSVFSTAVFRIDKTVPTLRGIVVESRLRKGQTVSETLYREQIDKASAYFAERRYFVSLD